MRPELIVMPTDRAAFDAALRWVWRRGRESGIRSVTGSAPPRGVTPCEGHPRFDEGCLNCVEADAYCEHGRIFYHPDAPPDAPCWRPPYIGDVP